VNGFILLEGKMVNGQSWLKVKTTMFDPEAWEKGHTEDCMKKHPELSKTGWVSTFDPSGNLNIQRYSIGE
jgi:hypothetical protein